MRPFLVVNPHSANGQTGRRWPEMEARARAVLGDFGHAFTERIAHAPELVRRALDQGYDCVVAVGGDGTLNEVVNGLMAAGAPADVALGVVPRGTGGDFPRTFAWSQGLDAALDRLSDGKRRVIDVGRVELTRFDGATESRFFANVCSFGASGRVVRELNRGGRALGGRVGFFWATVKGLAGYTDRRVRLSVDGQGWEEARVTTVAVANGRFFGGGMCVAPEADASDGLFDVTVWSGYRLTDLAIQAPKLYNGAHVRLSGTRTFRCHELRAESDEEVLLDCDGEAPGRLPIRITLVPGALHLLG